MDRYIFGHPKGTRFDSPIKFFKHFEHLIGKTKECECILCSSPRTFARRKSLGRSDAEPAGKKLKPAYRSRNFTEDYEKQSPEHALNLDNYHIHESDIQLPRVGEIILFPTRGIVQFHPETAQIEAVSDEGIHQTDWRAGRVLKVVEDKVKVETDLHSWTETISDPKTVRINYRQQLPISVYKEVLDSIPRHEWHPSVRQALRLMSSIHIVTNGYTKRYPTGKIEVMVDGLIIGGEHIRCGDCVRILTSPTSAEVGGVLLVGWVVIILKPDGQIETSQNGTPKIFLGGNVFYPEPSPTSRQTHLDPTEENVLPRALRCQQLYPTSDWSSNSQGDSRHVVMIPAELALDRMRGPEDFLAAYDLREGFGAEGVVEARLGIHTVYEEKLLTHETRTIGWTVTNHVPPSLRNHGKGEVTLAEVENDLNGFISTLLS